MDGYLWLIVLFLSDDFAICMTDFAKQPLIQDLDDSLLTASSWLPSCPPYNVRYTSDTGWCAGDIDEPNELFLQVDLNTLYTIQFVELFGRSDTKEFVTSYGLYYSSDGVVWSQGHSESKTSSDVFAGPSRWDEEGASGSITYFDEPIVARYIRIVPLTWFGWPSLRVEAYGAALSEQAGAVGVENSIGSVDKRAVDSWARGDASWYLLFVLFLLLAVNLILTWCMQQCRRRGLAAAAAHRLHQYSKHDVVMQGESDHDSDDEHNPSLWRVIGNFRDRA